jgi:hypothetical protein
MAHRLIDKWKGSRVRRWSASTFPQRKNQKWKSYYSQKLDVRVPPFWLTQQKNIMAIYESAVSRESSLSSSSSSSSLLAKVMDFMLGGPMHRATVTMMALIFGSRSADPYARMMMPLRNNKSTAVSTTMSMRTITFWVCFVAVALAYSKRTISVDVWKSILKRPTTPTKKKNHHRNSNHHSNSDESFEETIVAVYALCRKLVRYAVDALEKAKQQQQRNRGGAEPPPQQDVHEHDLSPAQHRGSCHCGAVKFVVFAAKTLYVESMTSTTTDPQCRRILPYEYARINNTSLTWDEGHVQSYDSRYFFCPSCGVHLAHAVVTTSSTNNNVAADEMIQLFINVDCLDGSSYILRPVSSRPQEAISTNSFGGRRPLDVPLTVPVPVVADHRHHATLVSECASTIAGTQQRQQLPPPRHSPSSPSVSALDDDLEYMSTTADNNDVRSINLLGTPTTTTTASVTSGQTTEELAVTAYRLRKALLAHTAASSSTATTATATTKTSSSVSPLVVAAAAAPCSQTEGDDDDDDDKNDDDDDDDDDNPGSHPDAASSPTTHESSRSPKAASVPIYHSRGEPAAAEESLSITSDAEKLRRYLGKHNSGG